LFFFNVFPSYSFSALHLSGKYSFTTSKLRSFPASQALKINLLNQILTFADYLYLAVIPLLGLPGMMVQGAIMKKNCSAEGLFVSFPEYNRIISFDKADFKIKFVH